MNWAASHLAIREMLRRAVQNRGVFTGGGWASKLLAKGNKVLCQARPPSLREEGSGSYHTYCLTFFGRKERDPVIDYLIGAAQKIPD